MSRVESISLNIANKLGERLNKSKEEVAVLNYGLFVIIHTSIVLITTIIAGIVTNSLKEIIIISFCSAMLKRYSGGVHASSPTRCLVLGVSMSTIFALICRLFVNKLDSIPFLLVLIISTLISYFILYKRCPIGTEKNPLKKESRRKLLRKKSFNVMNMYSICTFTLYVIYIINSNMIIKSISMSILFGALIQIFALSKIGERIITGIDKTL